MDRDANDTKRKNIKHGKIRQNAELVETGISWNGILSKSGTRDTGTLGPGHGTLGPGHGYNRPGHGYTRAGTRYTRTRQAGDRVQESDQAGDPHRSQARLGSVYS